MTYTNQEIKEMLWLLKEKQVKARTFAYMSMMLRIFELVVPVQIKSFSVESFDKILSFKLFQGTGTWILMRVVPLYLTAKLIHSLYGNEFEQFHLWILAEITYIFLHFMSHIAISLVPNYATLGLFSRDSLIVYIYCTIRVLSVCIVDTYYKSIEDNENKLSEALKKSPNPIPEKLKKSPNPVPEKLKKSSNPIQEKLNKPSSPIPEEFIKPSNPIPEEFNKFSNPIEDINYWQLLSEHHSQRDELQKKKED